MRAFKGRDPAAFVALCLFIETFEITQGSFTWLLYFLDDTINAASGFATGAQLVNLMLITFTFEFMINSPMQIYGTIRYFDGMTLLSLLFCVQETRGLINIEKKMLDSPKVVLNKQIMKL